MDALQSVSGSVAALTKALSSAAQAVETAVAQAARSVDHTVDAFVGRAASAWSVDQNVRALRPFDTYTVTGSADVSVPGFKALGRGSLEVRRALDGTYVVSMTAEAFAGLFVMSGVDVSLASTGLKRFFGPGVGGRVEFSFATAAEAAQAARRLEREASLGLSASAKPGEPQDALLAHLSALELRGALVAQVKARLGLGGKGGSVSGLYGLARATGEEALRIELSQGRPTAVVLKETKVGVLSGQVGAMLARKGVTAGLPTGMDADLKGTVVEERRYRPPAGLSMGALLERLATGDKGLYRALGKTEGYRFTASAEASGALLREGQGLQERLVLAGEGALPAGLGRAALETFAGAGRTAAVAAARRLPSSSVQFSERPFEQLGLGVSPQVRIQGTGGGFDLAAVRRRYQEPSTCFLRAAPKAQEALVGSLDGSIAWGADSEEV